MATLGLLLLLALFLVAFVLQANRHEQRIDTLLRLGQRDRATPNPDTAALIALTENLCQRIQAPQQAVIDHTVQQTVTPDMVPPAVPPDDDKAFWDNRPLSKEALAEILMAEEVTDG